jgi:hypothetical protein
MPGRLGPRFAIEALFLIALAVAAAYADLESKWILLVMAGGWLVVALLELTADRIWAAAPPWRRPYYVPAAPPRAGTAAAPGPPAAIEPVRETDLEPESPPELAPAAPAPTPAPAPEAVTMIGSRVEPEAQPELNDAAPEADGQRKPEQDDTDPAAPKLEPLEAEPKRRWFRRRERQAVAAEAPEIEMPKHVRLLPASERTDRSPDEVTELFDAPRTEDPTSR